MDDIYKKAVLLNGMEAQVRKAAEEFTELSLALQQYINKRYIKGIDKIKLVESIYEEIADADIMIIQLKCLFDEKEIENIKNQKLERLEKILELKNEVREK